MSNTWIIYFFLIAFELECSIFGAVKSLNHDCAAAAKSLQSCPTLCDPIDSSPLGFSVSGILQARTLEWVAISFSKAWKWKVKVKSLSHARLFTTPWTAAYQAPPSIGFSRQESWSGVPLPSPNHGLSTSMKWHNLQVDKKDPNIFSTKKIHLNFKDKDRLNLKGWRQKYHARTDQKAGIACINFIQSRLQSSKNFQE